MRFGDRRGAVQLRTAAAELLVLWRDDDVSVRLWWLEQDLELLDEQDLRMLGYPSNPRVATCVVCSVRRWSIRRRSQVVHPTP